jgi:DNA mismatch repair protein MutS2
MPSPETDTAPRALEFDRILAALERYTFTDEGRERIGATRPSRDPVWIAGELQRVDEVRGLYARGGNIVSGGLKDLRGSLRRTSVVGSALEPEELLTLLQHLRVWATLRKTLERERTAMKLTFQLTQPLTPLPDLEKTLERAISPEATVRDSASPELGRIRRAIADRMDGIRRRLAQMLPRLMRQGVLREESFSIRDGRYVVPVRSDALSSVKGIIHDRSATGGTLFVEPAALVDAGNELRTLELAERDEMRRILQELTTRVRDELERIEVNRQVMTTLDVISAKSRLADELDAINPLVGRDIPVRVIGGRHPLLALAGERTVVPLNLELGTDYTTLVISGPNAGGKSVALKCVGLLCLMASCGIPVPAQPGTELPLFDRLLVYIGDQQSLADDLSTFTAHARGLKNIVEYATPRALVLIDEIGAGTDPQEGSALSIAVLERLTAAKAPTIVTTHHSALKAFAHATAGCANGSMEFDTATFQPTYRFHPNLPGSSYALEIARRAGLQDDIISRARTVLGGERTRLEELITSLSEKLQKYESLLVGEEKRAAEQQALEREIKRRLERLERREKEVKQKAVQEAEEIVKQARRTVEALVKEIRERNADRESILKAKHALNYELQITNYELEGEPELEIRNVVPQPPSREPEPEVHPDKEPEVGDCVSVDDSATVGEVTAVSGRGDRVCVAVGTVQLWVTRKRVKVVEAPVTEVKVRVFAKLPDVPFELDVRGLDAPEAVARVDKYLYDGLAAGREKVGIIHGKGMGILAKFIRQMLKEHPAVADFRYGEYGEGDYGVTVVELKK